MQIPPVFKTGDLLKDVKFICNFLRQYKKGDPLIQGRFDSIDICNWYSNKKSRFTYSKLWL